MFGYQLWQRWKKDDSQRLPTAKLGAPILVEKQGSELLARDGALVLSLRLLDKTRPKHELAIRPFKGAQWARVRKLWAGEIDHGDIKIVYEAAKKRKDGSKGKWFAIISTKEPRAKIPEQEGGAVLCMHRGHRRALTVVSSTGTRHPWIHGGAILATKRKLSARRAELKKHLPELGSGGKGHGDGRRFRLYRALEQREADAVKTWCQQRAADIDRQAERIGAAIILIEDYGGIAPSDDRNVRRFIDRFPTYQLKSAIANVCDRKGRRVVEVPSAYISTTCPQCDSVDARWHVKRTNMFHCLDCGYQRDADYVAAYQMLYSFTGDDGPNVLRDRERKVQALGKALQKKKTRKKKDPEAAE
jgi:hypothetical protein